MTSPATRKEIWGWGLYDFANSPFPTTIVTVVFSRYLAGLAGGDEGITIQLGWLAVRLPGPTFYSYTLSMAMLIVAVMSPVLGAIADYAGSKKRFLGVFCYLGVLATGLLYFTGPGLVWRAAFFFVLAMIGFAGANVFYNAFLPEIATPKNIGWISGFGFMLGYLSGTVVLALNLAMLQFPHLLGADEPFTPQDVFLSVALWWGVFAIPTFLWLRERKVAHAVGSATSYLRMGFLRLANTFRHIRNYSELSKFLLAFLIYNDGIQTVIVVSALYTQSLGMSETQIITLFLVVQATAMLGAWILGAISDRFGNKNTVILTLILWTAVAVWAYFIGIVAHPHQEAWALGIVAGLILGGSQSASRALQGSFTPEENSAEFFAFYGISQKFASIFGPAIYGTILAITGDHGSAILSLVVFFLVGLALLVWVDEPKGFEQAQTAVR